MTTLTFYLEGDHENLDWVRTRIDGAIHEVIDEAVEEGRIPEGSVGIDWEYED